MRNHLLLTTALLASLSLTARADDAPDPTLPKIPTKIFSITDDGANPDGKTLSTTAIQKTLTACEKAGGGTVNIPKGNFLATTLRIGSNTELHLDAGATLTLTPTHADIPVKSNRYANFLSATGAHDISITGEGIIDGNGATWYKQYARPAKGAAAATATALPRRPVLISFTNCSHVLLQNVIIINSPSVHVAFSGTDLTVDHAHFTCDPDSANTDGLDLTGRNILLSHTSFDVGEDNIAIRPTGDAPEGKANCQDITIADCSFLHGKGLSIGSSTLGGLRNLTVKNTTFDGTQNGIRLRASRTTGGTVENLTFDHLTMKDVRVPIIISSYFPTVPTNAPTDPAQPVTNATPVWKNFHFSDINADATLSAGQIVGLAEQPITDLTFTNCHFNAPKGLELIHAKSITFESSTITPEKGPPLISVDAQTTGFDASKTTPPSDNNLP